MKNLKQFSKFLVREILTSKFLVSLLITYFLVVFPFFVFAIAPELCKDNFLHSCPIFSDTSPPNTLSFVITIISILFVGNIVFLVTYELLKNRERKRPASVFHVMVEINEEKVSLDASSFEEAEELSSHFKSLAPIIYYNNLRFPHPTNGSLTEREKTNTPIKR